MQSILETCYSELRDSRIDGYDEEEALDLFQMNSEVCNQPPLLSLKSSSSDRFACMDETILVVHWHFNRFVSGPIDIYLFHPLLKLVLFSCVCSAFIFSVNWLFLRGLYYLRFRYEERFVSLIN